jgi:nucleotide-binding universal stress UspA family protein
MGNVKKLLVPIDFSPESGKALKYASSLAKQINAEIIALHVLDDLTGDDGLPALHHATGRLAFFWGGAAVPSD